MTEMKVLPLITLIIITCSGCKIGSHIAIDPSKVDSSESSIKEVEELINDYNNAVITKQYSKIDELTEIPFVLVNNDKTVNFLLKMSSSLSTKELENLLMSPTTLIVRLLLLTSLN